MNAFVDLLGRCPSHVGRGRWIDSKLNLIIGQHHQEATEIPAQRVPANKMQVSHIPPGVVLGSFADAVMNSLDVKTHRAAKAVIERKLIGNRWRRRELKM